MNRKGELTTTHLVGLIVLIASFAILLFFIFRLNPTEVSQNEICHNSVILKDKGEGLIGHLDCRTNYVCVSENFCEGFSHTKIIDSPLNLKKINQILAEEMSQCWWTFGQGEVDLSDFFDSSEITQNTCGICSIVRVDDVSFLDPPEIPSNDFYSFLEKEEIEEGENYLHYLYGTSLFPVFKERMFSKGIDLDQRSIDLRKDQLVIFGFPSKYESVFGDDEMIPPLLMTIDDPLLKEVCDNYDLTKL